MTLFRLDVTEYAPGNAATKRIMHGASFWVSEKRLLIYTMRSILTTRANSTVRHYLAASMMPAFRFFVDTHSAPDFSVSMPRVGSLRDFSVTSRVGEFAQGIAYAWMALSTGSRLCDFVEWSTSNYPSHPLLKKPDFAVLNLHTNSVDVVESKGTLRDMHWTPLNRALEQAKGIKGHPGVSSGCGVVVAFDAYGYQRASIHMQDPEWEGQASHQAMHDAFKRSYASWYDLSGEERKAAWCRGVDVGDLGKRNTDTRLRDHIIKTMGLDENAQFIVRPEIEEAIFSFDAFMATGRGDLSIPVAVEHPPNVIDFPDGTAIMSDG